MRAPALAFFLLEPRGQLAGQQSQHEQARAAERRLREAVHRHAAFRQIGPARVGQLTVVAVQNLSARDLPITFEQLPAKAQAFVKQHFKVGDIASVWKDDDIHDQDYKVYFNDGTQIKFYANGDWEEIKTRTQAVPAKLIPNGIAQYVKKTYPQSEIYKIQKKRYGYEVELANGLDLEFNANGQFLRIDD